MTYNQLIRTLQSLLESHAMIKTAKNATPEEWIYRENQVEFPVCCYSVVDGSLNKGQEQVYNVQLFFLDKSGQEAEFETDVISDQLQIASDVIGIMRTGKKSYTIDDQTPFRTISDKYEDYLAGVEITLNITTTSDNTCADIPLR